MNQLEQKELIQTQIDRLQEELKPLRATLNILEEEMYDIQDEYEHQLEIVEDMEKKIRELKQQIGIVMKGQMSILDYDI